MNATIPEPPSFVERFKAAQNADEIPHFQWKDALIVHFFRSEETNNLSYQAYNLCKEGSYPVRDLNSSQLLEFFRGRQNLDFKLKAKEKSLSEFAYFSGNGNHIQVIPLTLLSAPLGCILLPKDAQLDLQHIYQEHLPLYSKLLDNCLMAELFKVFNVERLQEIATEKELIQAFISEIEKWLMPTLVQSQLDGEIIYNRPYAKEFNNEYQLKIELNGEKTYHLHLHFTSFFYPVNGQSDEFTNVYQFRFRKMVLSRLIEEFFQYQVYTNWKSVQSSIFNYEAQIKKVRAYFLEILKILGIVNTQLDQLPASKEAFFNASGANYFYQKNGKWMIQFDGTPIDCRCSSPQGRESIRYLLEHPNQVISVETLYKHLHDNGFKKGESRINVRSKKEDKQVRQQEHIEQQDLKKTLNEAYNMRQQIHNYALENQKKYWAYILDILKKLMRHGLGKRYIHIKEEVKANIQKINLELGLDDNFVEAFESGTISKTNYQVNKNVKDSINRGIRDEIRNLEKHYPKFYKFLEETIVYNTKKTPHAPYQYRPGLSTESRHHFLIDWETTDPDLEE